MRASCDGDPAAEFDEDFAAGFGGKWLPVGVNDVAHHGAVDGQEHLHGVVVAVTSQRHRHRTAGLPRRDDLARAAGAGRPLRAKSGVYPPCSTGEAVEDPDFVPSLTVCSGERH